MVSTMGQVPALKTNELGSHLDAQHRYGANIPREGDEDIENDEEIRHALPVLLRRERGRSLGTGRS